MWYEFNFVPERNLFWKYVKSTLRTDNYIFWGEGWLGQITFFFTGEQITFFVFRCSWGGGGEVTGNGWGCLYHTFKVSDLVPFTMSQTSVGYQRPSWYILGCFLLNKIPEISITRTILMIWLKPLKYIDKGVYFLGFFNFFVLELVLFRSRDLGQT